ncbi:MAG: hypothetical protein ACOZF0_04770 [Thermodesulfobacteriota bacterium]
MTAIARDMSELKRTQQSLERRVAELRRLELAMEQTGEAVVITDSQGDEGRARTPGSQGFVLKPVIRDKIARAIRQALAGSA